MTSRRIPAPAFQILLAFVLVAAAARAEPATAGGRFDELKLRELGPAVGGRVSRVAGVPGDPRTYWAASAQGGVWKSEDGGLVWKPVFDDQPVASIGSIAVAPSDPNVVWVGSGEANIRGNVIAGRGIFRSTDAGKTWKHVWRESGQIGTVAVHPADPDVAFAAVLGHAFGPNPERGVYRTLDGGESWERVLFVDADTGASDVALDPGNPRIVFAGLWQARRRPWEMTSGGPGSGLYRSPDGGASWRRLEGHGLPAGPWGRVGVAVAPSDGRRVYALIEAGEGGLYRSDDGGESWKRANGHRTLTQRAWYYSTLTVDPADPDKVWFPQVRLLRTVDGGRTLQSVPESQRWDHHDLWIDPRDARRMIVGSDGGVSVSLDGGRTWTDPRLPVAQFYNVDADYGAPFRVGGTMQDFGTASGPSDSLRREGIVLGDWRFAGGGEAGDFVYDPGEPGVVYAGEYGGYISVHDERTGATRNVSILPWDASGHGAADLRYRFQWTAPIAVSPFDAKELYHGANVLFRSRDRGATWQAISPDLTRNDPARQQWSGGPITGDNTGVEVYDTIFSLALSPLEPGTIWVGTDDGLVHVTRDGGGVWSDVTPPGLPEWGTVESIEVSRHAAGTAWVAVDAHRLDDLRPYLWRTGDHGTTWTELSAGLPQDEPLFVVREDPERAGLLWAGTERGLWFSRDAGAGWERLKANLPTVKVVDLVIRGDDLVVATSGRGLWILDGLGPVRAWSDAVAASDLHLFPPRPALRRLLGAGWSEEAAAPNPPRGAVVDYWLREAAPGEVTLEIIDGGGRTVRRLSSVAEKARYPADDPDEPAKEPEAALSAAAGLHRAVWNLTWQGASRLEGAKYDAGDPTAGPLALPGSYTLRLRAGGREVTAPLEVLPDPRSGESPAALALQLESALALRDRIEALTADIRRVRAIAAQANDLAGRLEGDTARADLAAAARRLAERAGALEAKLHNPDAEVVYDILARRGGARLLSRLVYLYASLVAGED
ncbi:MAG: glycosyl hydrolase, partial [Thermoanaerobaculia bacterium]